MGNEDSMVDDEEAPLTSGGRAPEPEPAPKTDYSQYASTYDPVDTSQADAPAPSYRSVTSRLRSASCVVDALRGSSDRSLLVSAVSSRLAGNPVALRAAAARRTRRRSARRMVRTGSSRSARSRRRLLTTMRTSTSIVRQS